MNINQKPEIMNNNGITTTTTPGKENFEMYQSAVHGRELCQYDYRHFDGQLFTTVKNTLEECRDACRQWKRKQPVTRIDYLGFVLTNSWNSDGWVVIQEKPYDHLGNYETLDNAKESALMYFLMKHEATKHIVHSMALYGFGRYHEWSIFKDLCRREGVAIPKEIHCSKDTNRSICFNNTVFTNTKNRK